MRKRRKRKAFYTLALLRARRDALIPTACIRWMDFSTEQGFFHVFKNELDAKVGYLIWAQFNDEAMRMIIASKRVPPYSYEWNEGIINFLLDICYDNHGYRLSRSALAAALPPDVDKIAYVRRNRVRLLRRIGDRLRLVRAEDFLTGLSLENA